VPVAAGLDDALRRHAQFLQSCRAMAWAMQSSQAALPASSIGALCG
jgi:hypothetical protein